jgi:hypothetical protein
MKTPIRFTAILLLAGVALSSCAPVAHDSQVVTAKEKVFSTKKTYLQGAAAGALVGAGLGAALNENDRGGGALVGGLIGLGVGTLYANHVVKQRQAYRNASDYLTACTGIAEGQRDSAGHYNATLSNRISAIEKEDAMVRGTIKDSNEVKDRLTEEIDLQKKALTQAQNEKASSSTIRKQENKIKALEHEKRNLVATIERLSKTQEKPALAGQ